MVKVKVKGFLQCPKLTRTVESAFMHKMEDYTKLSTITTRPNQTSFALPLIDCRGNTDISFTPTTFLTCWSKASAIFYKN